MTERHDDEKPPSEGDEPSGSPEGQDASPPEADLRSLLGGGGATRRVTPSEPDRRQRPDREVRDDAAEDDGFAPPYVPPVRPGDPVRPPERAPEPVRPVTDDPQNEAEPQKLPPVWPGDEKQPWFRRERGLAPLPETLEGEQPTVDLEDLPTPLAEIQVRGWAWGVTFLLPNVLGVFLPLVGFFVGLAIFIPNLFLFRTGRDVGTVIFGLRVVRDNGDVAGFFQMFVRNAASTISFLALGFGYWTAFSDPQRRTWHDRWLKTYVVRDSTEYNGRKTSSSELAFNWFWIIILLVIAAIVLFAFTGTVPVETTPTEGGGGGGTTT